MKIKRVIGSVFFALFTVVSIFGWEEVKLSLVRQEGNFYNLSFEKLGNVEYNSVIVEKDKYDHSGEKIKNQYSNSRDENYKNKIIDMLYNLELREVSSAKYRKNRGGMPMYRINFSGIKEEKESESISYILTNTINIRLDGDGDYIEISLNYGRDLRKVNRYKIVSGGIDFNILDAFIEDNKN